MSLSPRHRLLLSQIRKHVASEKDLEGLEAFLEAVDLAYQENDQHRELLERSIALSSDELCSRNQELRQQQARMVSLNEVVLKQARALAMGTGILAEQLAQIANALSQALEGRRATIWLLGDDGASLECMAQCGVPSTSWGVGSKLPGELVPTLMQFVGRRRYVTLERDDPQWRACELPSPWADELMALMIASAVRQDGRSLGLVCCESQENTRCGEVEGGFVASMADLVTLALESSRRREAELQRAKLESTLRQAQRFESIGLLAGGVAHDFNNLLTPILGNAEIALESLAPGTPLYEDLREIQQAALAARDLVSQLLGLARKQLRETRAIDLSQAVSEGARMMSRLIPPGITLKLELSEKLPPIKADAAQLNQILMNLLVNAVDAIGAQGEIVIGSSLDADGRVTLTVRDNGRGMDEETALKIFDPFFTTKEAGRGVGLGLATVYSLVHQHGGQVSVESELGKGTLFVISFPATTEAIEAKVANRENPKPSEAQATVLVVEDELAVLRMITRILRAKGYRVLEAATPSEAIAIVDKHGPEIDLLLSDVVLPEMDGRRLHAELSPKIQCPVLFMSGHSRNILGESALDPSISFLRKPFSPAVLIDKIGEMARKPAGGS